MRLISLACAVMLLAGCMLGPDYKKPDAPTSETFKELQGWTPGNPADAIDKGAWWSVYNDPELDRLERMVDVSNQTIKQFEAQYFSAVDLVAVARAGLFPTLTAGGSDTVSGSGAKFGGVSTTSGGSVSRNGTIYALNGNAAWDLDIWGRIRRQIESNTAAAQVSAADLANARLSDRKSVV